MATATFGPKQGTVGQITKFVVDNETRYIQVRNDTPNDLLIAFTPNQPAIVTTANGEWANVAPAWDHPVIPVNGWRGASRQEQGYNTIGQFSGTVWILPINNGGLVLPGTTSVRNNIYLTSFGPYDALPSGSSLPRQQDVSSQARVVSVPISVSQLFSNRTVLSVAVINKFSLGAPTAAQLAAKSAIFYLYWATLGLGSIGVNAITGWSINLEVYPGDASNNPIAGFTPIRVYNMDLFASNNNAAPFAAVVDKHVFTPPFPLAVGVVWTSGTPANLCLRVNAVGGFGSATLISNIAADYDFANTSHNPGDIGNNTSAPFGTGGSDPQVY